MSFIEFAPLSPGLTTLSLPGSPAPPPSATLLTYDVEHRKLLADARKAGRKIANLGVFVIGSRESGYDALTPEYDPCEGNFVEHHYLMDGDIYEVNYLSQSDSAFGAFLEMRYDNAAVVIVYSVTSLSSFEHARKLLESTRRHANANADRLLEKPQYPLPPQQRFVQADEMDDEFVHVHKYETAETVPYGVVLVGLDKGAGGERVVSVEEGEKLADEFGVLFREDSGKRVYGVQRVFGTVVESVQPLERDFLRRVEGMKEEDVKWRRSRVIALWAKWMAAGGYVQQRFVEVEASQVSTNGEEEGGRD